MDLIMALYVQKELNEPQKMGENYSWDIQMFLMLLKNKKNFQLIHILYLPLFIVCVFVSGRVRHSHVGLKLHSHIHFTQLTVHSLTPISELY